MIRLQQMAQLVMHHRIQRVLRNPLQLRGDANLRGRVGRRAPALTLVAHPANREPFELLGALQLRQVGAHQQAGPLVQVLVGDIQLRGVLTAGGATLNTRQQAGNMLVYLLARARGGNEQAVRGVAVLVHAVALHADGAGAAG